MLHFTETRREDTELHRGMGIVLGIDLPVGHEYMDEEADAEGRGVVETSILRFVAR